MKPFKLKNKVQKYSWGTKDFIPDLLGLGQSGEPWAELWMGNHPKAPSSAILDGQTVSLDDLINKYPEEVLGKDNKRFHGKLPFLFKVLSAGSPLSIQAHPDKSHAEAGFQDENSRSVPLDAFNRNYKDDNHKPEIICALTPFTAMCGFRTLNVIENNFQNLKSSVFTEFLYPVLKKRGNNRLSSFFAKLMALKASEMKNLIGSALEWADNKESPEAVLIKKFSSLYDTDPGILAPLYLNVILLEPGDALYQGAGELHAYVEGTGIELMANSDNVLRGGLTPKHVDVDELLKILTFSEGESEVLKPKPVDSGRYYYETPSNEFELGLVKADNKEKIYIQNRKTVEILLCVRGSVSVKWKDGFLSLTRGESALIPAYIKAYSIEGDGELFSAGIPGSERQ